MKTTHLFRTVVLLAAVMMLLGTTSCLRYEKKENTSTAGTATLMCDETFRNIMEQEVDVFEYQYPDAHILARYGTQSAAVDSLMALNTQTIVIARDLTAEELKYLKTKRSRVRSQKIAVDALAFIINQKNPVEMLTLGELGDILSGRSPRWDDLQPCKLGTIKVVVDNAGSSVVKYLSDSLCNGRPLGENVFSASGVPEVFAAVEKDPNAIGVLGVSWITSDMGSADLTQEELAKQVLSEEPVEGATLTQKVKVMKLRRNDEVRAYKPYQQNIFDGTYPLFRQIYMITTAHPGSPAGGFYSFVTGDIGQKIILKTGIMPSRMNIQVVQVGE